MPAPDAVAVALDLHDRAGCFCCDNLPAIYADKDGAYHDAIYQSRIDLLKAARAAHAAMVEALEAISALWPKPPNCAPINPEWVGENDGKTRAIKLEAAIDIARTVLAEVQP